MLDIRFIKENLDAVKANITARNMNADPDQALELQDQRGTLIQELDALRARRNEVAGLMKKAKSQDERQPLIDEGKELKDKIPAMEQELAQLDEALKETLMRIPNMAHPDAPVGKEEKDNLEIKRWGDIPNFDFKPKDHVQLGAELDLIDFDSATPVSGTKFYYLKSEAVLLELALNRYALQLLQAEGFTPMITPDIAKEDIVAGTGFNPRGEESNIYTIEGTGTCLVGTAEITLGGYHSNQILDEAQLPIKYAGLSHCFRREAGASGQFSKGLYRVHQFTKVEMFVYCTPEQSAEIHDQLLAIEEKLFQGLEIPYRVVDTCTGDLGAAAYRKYDMEAWMPGRGENGDWGEVTSTSNCTDYQARRLKTRFKREGKNHFVHMLNGTALANSRAMVAILENHQQADGSVQVPKALVPYMGVENIGPRSPRS